MSSPRPLGAAVALLAILLSAVELHAAEPPNPQARLLDTVAPSNEAWSATAVAGQTGWLPVEEENLDHRFPGDIALINDKLVVVLRWQGVGAEVYRRTRDAWKPHAVLRPAAASGSSGRLTAVRTLENNAGAVMVEATIETSTGEQMSFSYRLAAGQLMVEARGGEGAETLAVVCQPDWVLVPDFFGDDLAFGPATTLAARQRIGLPSDNFFLGMLDGGSAILMCVWESDRQQAAIVFSGEEAQRHVSHCEVLCAKDQAIWVAFLEGPDLWHAQTLRTAPSAGEIALDWKPPFDAKWRASLVLDNDWTTSSYFRRRGEPAQPAAAMGTFVPNQSPADCLLDGDRAVVQRMPAASAHPPVPDRTLLVYPIDRSPATPLTAFCPIDVLRSTLGVGPCQYILQTEGLSSETNPTPESVAAWVSQQFSRKKEQQSAEQLQDLLAQMVGHVGRAEVRIGRYAELAAELDSTLKSRAAGDEGLGQLHEGVRRLMTIAAAGRGGSAPPPSQRAAELATDLQDLIGQANPLAECQRLAAELQAVGAFQDWTLANCRMSLRWLRERAKAVQDPPQSATARGIQSRIEQFLQTK